MLNTLNIIFSDVDKVTQTDIDRVIMTLDPPEDGEEVLLVMPEAFHTLWALQLDYIRKSHLALHAATFDAKDEQQKLKLVGEANRWKTFAEITRDMCWAECRDLIGERAWQEPSIAIRKGFVLVSSKPDEQSPPVRSQIVLGAIGELAKRILRDIPEEPDPEERKPQ